MASLKYFLSICINGPIWIIFLIVGLTVLTWSPEGTLVNAGSFVWPLDFPGFFEHTLHVWDSSVNLGYMATRQIGSAYPYAMWGSILIKTGIEPHWVQVIFFYISFSFSGIGAFFLARELKWNQTAALISGGLYMFSPYAAIIVWNPVYGFDFSFYAFLPLNLFLYLRFISLDTTLWQKSGYALATGLSLFSMSFVNPAYLIFYIALLFLFFIYACSISNNFTKTIVLLVSYISLLFLLNSTYFLSLIVDLQHQFLISDSTASGHFTDLEIAKLNSVSMNDAFRMTGFWPLFIGEQSDPYYTFRDILKTSPYIFISYAIPLMAILALFNIKNHVKPSILLLGVLFVFSLQLNVGFKADSIFKWVNDIIFSQEMLTRSFRAIHIKLGTGLVLPVAFLSGYWLDKFIRSRLDFGTKATISGGLALLFAVFMATPFYNGTIIKPAGNYLPSYNVKFPDEYMALRSQDRERPLEGRYLSLPLPSNYNYGLKWKDGGYRGGDLLRPLLSKPLFFVNFNSPINRQLEEAINTEDPALLPLLGLYNFRYILSHKDIVDSNIAGHYRTAFSIDDKRLEPWIDNPYFNIDVVSDDYFMPKWYTANIIWQSSKNNTPNMMYLLKKLNSNDRLAVISNDTPLPETSSQNLPITEFRKISPVSYRLKLHNAVGFVPLVFNEGCHPGWKLYPDTNAPLQGNSPLGVLSADTPDQATPKELAYYQKQGWITGFPPAESSPKFISSLKKGTIQNDNLPSVDVKKVLGGSPLPRDLATHACGNAGINTWIIDINKLCSSPSGICKKNGIGYDLELIAAFEPQKLFYLGKSIALFTFSTLAAIFFLGLVGSTLNRQTRRKPTA